LLSNQTETLNRNKTYLDIKLPTRVLCSKTLHPI
jgi:hypothetical protein